MSVSNAQILTGPQAPSGGLKLRLPATSANLGPGFDTLALALGLYLEVEAQTAPEYSIAATGRDSSICSRIEDNQLLRVYRETVQRYTGREAVPLALVMRNGIPLGMGCGSSAASRLAAVALASHFGGLGWRREQGRGDSGDRILAEAARLEGHPDNAAACWLGGFVASGWSSSLDRERIGSLAERLGDSEPSFAQSSRGDLTGAQPAGSRHWAGDLTEGGAADEETPEARQQVAEARRRVAAVSIAPRSDWRALLVIPGTPLATSESRAVLPMHYSREDAVLNLQKVAVLTAAFATGRGDLLAAATADSLHQPYRSAVCPLLGRLLPLAGRDGILSVTLSGAGPAVLLLLEHAEAAEQASMQVLAQLARAGGQGMDNVELILCDLAGPAEYTCLFEHRGKIASDPAAK